MAAEGRTTALCCGAGTPEFALPAPGSTWTAELSPEASNDVEEADPPTGSRGCGDGSAAGAGAGGVGTRVSTAWGSATGAGIGVATGFGNVNFSGFRGGGAGGPALGSSGRRGAATKGRAAIRTAGTLGVTSSRPSAIAPPTNAMWSRHEMPNVVQRYSGIAFAMSSRNPPLEKLTVESSGPEESGPLPAGTRA